MPSQFSSQDLFPEVDALPPGQEVASNARGMPGWEGGGCSSFDLTGTLPTKHNNYDKSKRCQSTYAWQNWQWKETSG